MTRIWSILDTFLPKSGWFAPQRLAPSLASRILIATTFANLESHTYKAISRQPFRTDSEKTGDEA